MSSNVVTKKLTLNFELYLTIRFDRIYKANVIKSSVDLDLNGIRNRISVDISSLNLQIIPTGNSFFFGSIKSFSGQAFGKSKLFLVWLLQIVSTNRINHVDHFGNFIPNYGGNTGEYLAFFQVFSKIE